jgi:uncharacterized protein (UPF0276 family)
MRVGVAYNVNTPGFLRRHAACVDFVEVTHELLCHDASVLDTLACKPIILHCASLNIAGSVQPPDETIAAVRRNISCTKTPWLGEHLAFITADRSLAGMNAEEYAPGEPYNIGFTVGPAMNPISAAAIANTAMRYTRELGASVLLENSPIYFDMPGTVMCQVDFLIEVCRCPTIRLLLDLTHFFITSRNTGTDPYREVLRLPLDRVDEIHISGASYQEGSYWDDHAVGATAETFELLRAVLGRAKPRAVTLEYNWSAQFPEDILIGDIERVRQIASAG